MQDGIIMEKIKHYTKGAILHLVIGTTNRGITTSVSSILQSPIWKRLMQPIGINKWY